MDNAHFYTTIVNWEKDRIGNLSSPTLPDIKVATPPEFPKGSPNIWSPEHMFVASANICLMTTFLAIAENSKFDFKSFSSEATGKLEKVDGKFMISEIEFKPVVTIDDESKKDKAIRLIEKSEMACLISNSMKSKMILTPTVEIAG
ncbi:MAG: OsmC family protein [Ignavibacteriaceae bacterium]